MLGVMSVGWMAVVAVLVTAQELLPPRDALDVPLAAVIVAFGVLIIADPSSVQAGAADGCESHRRLHPSRTMRESRKETAQ
jgi:hypothetical protein